VYASLIVKKARMLYCWKVVERPTYRSNHSAVLRNASCGLLVASNGRAALDRFLAPGNASVTLQKLTRAARAIGHDLQIELV
jgi:hypothetical protein